MVDLKNVINDIENVKIHLYFLRIISPNLPCFFYRNCTKIFDFPNLKVKGRGAWGYKCNQGPAVAVLGLRLNWVMKLAWRGERMMSAGNVITPPRALLASELAAFPISS